MTMGLPTEPDPPEARTDCGQSGVDLLNACREVLRAGPSRLDDEYFYNCVPLCIIDSVYSIGVRYEGVRNAVERFSDYLGLRKFRIDRKIVPAASEQLPTSELVRMLREAGPEIFAEQVFQNRQRTSTRSGILKSEAVLRFGEALVLHGGEYLQDIPGLLGDHSLEKEVKGIPGQSSGLSLGYFFMLAGSEDQVKPDRMILRFLSAALGRDVQAHEAQHLLGAACSDLLPEFPELTPRLLDHCIWHVQRKQG